MISAINITKQFSVGLFRTKRFTAVENVSFQIRRGEILGLCGESGCGKSTVGRILLRLIQPTAGRMMLDHQEVPSHKKIDRDFRKKVQIIFQDADGALDSKMRTRDLLLEPLKVHGLLNGDSARALNELMDLVNLTPELAERYPHELSGGQRQRISIARAVCLNPEFLVADEPTASLDLLVQSQMLNLLKKIQTERRIGCLFISHNLPSVRRMANRTALMYLGRIVEIGPTADIFERPAHPYTRAMLDAAPLDLLSEPEPGQRRLLQGDVFSQKRPAQGCLFQPRCPQALEICAIHAPEKKSPTPDHHVWCHFDPVGAGKAFL